MRKNINTFFIFYPNARDESAMLTARNEEKYKYL